ncbi:MAG: hypothetical protein ABSD58_19570 [Verrucomicrobiia bacterium]|jgi:hypothetical protein
MKRFSLIPMIVATLLATKTLAGNLTVNGNLTVTTNLTAQSVTLGGVTQTSWPAALAGGYKYVIVAEGTNDLQRGSNLQAAYTTATTLNPTSSNRVVVLVSPGSYNLGSSGLTMNTSYVDLIGLVPSQMTTKQVFTDSAGITRTKTVANVQCPVLVYSSASAGTLVQSVDYIRIESVILTNTGSGVAYGPSVNGINTVLRHVSMSSMPSDFDYDGEYVDCVGGSSAFGNDTANNSNYANGTFVDCVGGDNSFGAGSVASGTFIGCTGGDSSFAGSQGFNDALGYNDSAFASGAFINCVGGDESFGGEGTASGTFRGCVGGYESFGGDGEANGTFIDCVGGDVSFAGNDGWTQHAGYADGTFIDCVGGSNCFGGNGGSLDLSAKLQHCQAGAGSFYFGASADFNYNVGGSNTFLMLPQLPTSTNGLPSGTVYNSSGTLKVMP